MSKWHSRWPGDYAFKEGPSRRGPERNHTSTLVAPVALVDHGADTVERRYRELRARQEEQAAAYTGPFPQQTSMLDQSSGRDSVVEAR